MLTNEVTDSFSTAKNSSVKLYRGIGNMKNDAYGTEKYQPIRLNRNLLHSSPLSGLAFDTAMEACGYPMRKSNTVSVTQDPEQAIFYGGVCRVFPMDGTQYLYSPKVGDFLTFTVKLLGAAYKEALKRGLVADIPGNVYPDDDVYNKALSGQVPFVKRYVKAIGKQACETVDIRVTSNLEEVKAAMGEILIFGTPVYLAIRDTDP